jgi:ADP-ribosylglycohydrolase
MTTTAPSLVERIQGAIWGQLAGDAAALGTHWIYDLEVMHHRYPSLEGFEAPVPNHYHHPKRPGAQTHYGDGARVLLASVAKRGRFELDDFGRQFVARFSTYQGYLDHATRDTLTNVEAGEPFTASGADDDQLATASRLAPLVVAHLEDPELLAVVEQATRVTQNNDVAVAVNQANAVILRSLLRGAAIENALEDALLHPGIPEVAKELLARGRAEAALSTVEATRKLGQSCPLPRSFPAAVQALSRHGEAFDEAILATVRAGGDNAGRAGMLGAWLGAHLGLQGVPAAWRQRLEAGKEIAAGVAALLRQIDAREGDMERDRPSATIGSRPTADRQ